MTGKLKFARLPSPDQSEWLHPFVCKREELTDDGARAWRQLFQGEFQAPAAAERAAALQAEGERRGVFVGVDLGASPDRTAVTFMGGHNAGKNAVIDSMIERTRREHPDMTIIDLRKDKP